MPPKCHNITELSPSTEATEGPRKATECLLYPETDSFPSLCLSKLQLILIPDSQISRSNCQGNTGQAQRAPDSTRPAASSCSAGLLGRPEKQQASHRHTCC